MQVIEIAFTAYPVTDLKRARQFYEGTLGLAVAREFGDENMGWVEYDVGPGTLAIGKGMPDWNPSPGGGSVGLEVDSFQETMRWLKEKGVSFRSEAIETPVCHLAVVSDPDGNSITIHKRKS